MVDEKVIVLGHVCSMLSMRIQLALAEKGVEYDYRKEDFANKTPLLLQMNPVHKKIPVLIHNGKPICESKIIMEYIDDVWKANFPFLPSDPYQKSQERFWADVIDKTVNPGGRMMWLGKGEEAEQGKKMLVDGLVLLEEQLGDRQYFGHDRLGFLDIALIPYYSWFYTYEMFGNFSIEEHCPKLVAWAKRCMEMDNVSKSLVDPKELYQLVLIEKKKYDQ